MIVLLPTEVKLFGRLRTTCPHQYIVLVVARRLQLPTDPLFDL